MQNQTSGGNVEVQAGPRLLLAIGLNVGLTLVQLVVGVVSGSLAVFSDALHNLSDAGTMAIAYWGNRLGKRPPDRQNTFGYRRAEVIAAFVNFNILLILAVYLIIEAVDRVFHPTEIVAPWVMAVGALAFVVDVGTAWMMKRLASSSLSMRAVFIDNLADAMGSLGVMLTGAAIWLWQLWWLDAVMTLLIAAYVIVHTVQFFPTSIRILMGYVPSHLNLKEIQHAMQSIEGVHNVHHLHVWHLDEHKISLEAHVIMDLPGQNPYQIDIQQFEVIKHNIKTILIERFNIDHSTLEFEFGAHHPVHHCEYSP